MTEQEQDKYNRIRAFIAEHFEDFAFVVLDESGEIFYGFKNKIIGKALFLEATKTIAENEETDFEFVWEDEEEDTDEA